MRRRPLLRLERLEDRLALTAIPAFAAETKWHDFFSIGSEVPLAGDFDGNGKADLATFTRGSTGDVYVTLSSGTSFVGTSVKWHGNFCFNSEIPLVGDFNGDGRDDIATFTRGSTGDVYVSLSNGSSLFLGTSVKWHDNFCFNGEIPLVGDFNGDGKDDIATFTRGSTGTVYVALSTGSGFSGTGVRWSGRFCLGSETPLVGDFNGDGKDDIASFTRGTTGDVYVALSTGSSFSGTGIEWHDWFCIGSEVPAVGDFNGDGKDDIATFTRGTTGDVFVALSNGVNSFLGTGAKWHPGFCYGSDTPLVADYNGDGRADLARLTRGTTGDVYVSTSAWQHGANYAVLFSGGVKAANNHARYYDNIQAMYQTLLGACNVRPENVYVLYGDGTDPAIDRSDNVNSNMSYAAGSPVMAATPANLTTVLDQLANRVDATDSFLFYSFDHGGGSYNQAATKDEEVLNGWGGNINDDDLATRLRAIHGKANSYVFTQCYAGGMIDDLVVDGSIGAGRFAAAATNHYEKSYGNGFAKAFQEALASGWRTTASLFSTAKTNDPYAVTSAYAADGGAVVDGKEHPWSTGSDFRIFQDWFAGTSGFRFTVFKRFTVKPFTAAVNDVVPAAAPAGHHPDRAAAPLHAAAAVEVTRADLAAARLARARAFAHHGSQV